MGDRILYDFHQEPSSTALNIDASKAGLDYFLAEFGSVSAVCGSKAVSPLPAHFQTFVLTPARSSRRTAYREFS